MGGFVDRTGKKFGRLTAVQYITGSKWLCSCECGNQTIVPTEKLTAGHTRSCGCLKSEHVKKMQKIYRENIRKKHEAMEPTGAIIHKGYKFLNLPKHPMSWKKGYIKESRFVMSKHLGRNLMEYEVVHHKNGDRMDNRIENLEIFQSQSEHRTKHSQRVAAYNSEIRNNLKGGDSHR